MPKSWAMFTGIVGPHHELKFKLNIVMMVDLTEHGLITPEQLLHEYHRTESGRS